MGSQQNRESGGSLVVQVRAMLPTNSVVHSPIGVGAHTGLIVAGDVRGVTPLGRYQNFLISPVLHLTFDIKLADILIYTVEKSSTAGFVSHSHFETSIQIWFRSSDPTSFHP